MAVKKEGARFRRFKERSERLLREVVTKFAVNEQELRDFLRPQRGANTLGHYPEYQTTTDIARARAILRRLRDGEKWEDIQRGGLAQADEHELDAHPRYAPFHDILFVRRVLDEDDVDNVDGIDDAALPKKHRFHRFRAIKDGPGRGGFFLGNSPGPHPEAGLVDAGYRAVLSLAVTAVGSAAERGPVLSALPLNPDPAASSSCTCYLLNPSNLNYATAWTAEEWSDRPGDEGQALAPGPDVFSVLLASPAGKVYYLEKTEAEVIFREVNLSKEPEIWAQLRSGCVVGRVMYTHANTHEPRGHVTPLVNIHSLLPTDSERMDGHVAL